MASAEGIPDAESLLQDRSWACRLARSLVHDEHLAEDIVQAAYLATLDTPPPPAVRPRAWFGGVVRNIARMALRSGARRQRRESAATPSDPVPSAAALAAHAEQHRRLAALVLELEEPYRSVILLRYFGGMEPAAIAAHSGEPAATVRSRIKRGLDKLRSRLQQSDGDAWRGLLVPLIVDPRSAAVGAAAASAGATLGVLEILIGCVVLVVLGAGSWHAVRTWSGDRSGAGAAGAAPVSPHGRDSGDPASAAGPGAVRAQPFAEPGIAPVTGRVVDRLGAPVAGARVVVFPPDIDQTVSPAKLDEPARAGVTDAFGRYAIVPARAAGVVNLYAESPGSSPAVLESRQPSEDATLVLEPGRRISGRVTDVEGKPIAGARVRWHAAICGVSLVREAAPTGEDGAYEVADVLADGPALMTSRPPIAEAVVVAEGYAPAFLAVPQADDAGRIRLDAILARGATLSGTVLDAATSMPMAGARVAFWTQREHTSAPGPMGRALPDPTPVRGLEQAITDAAGRFRFTQLPRHDASMTASSRGSVGIVGAAAQGYSTAIRIVSLAAAESANDIVLACAPAGRVRGRIVDGSGRGLEGVALWLEPRMATHHFLPAVLADERSAVVTGTDGRFDLENVRCSAGGPLLEIVGRPRGLLGTPFRHPGVAVRPGEITDVGALAIGSVARLDVIVGDAHGAPVFGARVSLAPFYDGEDFEGQSVATDVAGRATIRCLEAAPGSGHRIVRVFAQHPAYARGSAFVMPGDAAREVRILLPPEHELGGRVVDEKGEPVLDAQVWLVDARVPKEQAFSNASELETASRHLPPIFAAVTVTRAGGRFLVRGLAMTKFHLAARRTSGWDREAVFLYDVDADRADLVVTLPAAIAPAATGDLEVAVSDAASARPLVDARVAVVTPSGTDRLSEGAMGVHRFAALPAGAYTLTVQARGFLEQTLLDVKVVAGASRLVEIRLEGGMTVEGTVIRVDRQPFTNAVISLVGDEPIIPPILGVVREDGAFSFEGLAPSRLYSVVVIEPGPLGPAVFVLPDRKRIAIPADPAKTKLRLEVIQAGVVWVLLEGGGAENAELLRGARLVVENDSGTNVFERGMLYRPSVPMSLPRGSYRVVLLRGDREVDQKSITVVAGESAEVRLALR